MTRPENLAAVNFAKAVNFAMRNGLWHCEISHCEIFALRILYCEIFALRNGLWHCEFSHCEFGIAKIFALRNCNLALRNAQWPAATVPLLLNPAASHPVSTASHFLHFSFDFSLILGFVDG